MSTHRKQLSGVVCCGVLYFLVSAMPVYAYMDPNVTGYVSQLVAPLTMIAATGVTFFRKQVGSAFRWLKNRIRG
jgi:hypothetical protein